MNPDMSWVGVLEHHATRTPDKPLAVFGDDVVTYRQMADRAAALAAGLQARGVGAGDVVGLLSYNSIEFLETIFAANHLGAIAMPINWRLAAAGGARSSSSTPRPGPSSATTSSRPRRTTRPTALDGDLVRVCISTGDATGTGSGSPTSGSRPIPYARVSGRGRRPPPADVHVRDDRAPEGRDDHPRQPGVEELRPHHRVRVHRAPTSAWPAGRCTTSARSTSSPPR